MKPVLIVVSDRDFDPSESAVTWKTLRDAGLEVRFTTPDGKPGVCDPRILDGWLPSNLLAKPHAVAAYEEMTADAAYAAPVRYEDVDPADYAGLVLVGGHAKGMKTYLESEALRQRIRAIWEAKLPIGAICHGGVALVRARGADGRSIVAGRTMTALPKWMEMSAWAMTAWKLGDYYRTYPITVEDEVREALGPEGKFQVGPWSTSRTHVVCDGNLVTARFPGDAEAFARALIERIRA
jgi:protease I